VNLGIEAVQDFFSQNVIYHYTSLETCLHHILPPWKLRLSPVKKMSDPFESGLRLFASGGMRTRDEQEYQALRKRVERVKAELEGKLNFDLKQISFCRNSTRLTKKDSLGMFRARMWDQYGESFHGVCLAIDKHALVKKNLLRGKPNWIADNVSYKDFDWIEHNREHLNYELFYSEPDDDKIIERYLLRRKKQIIFTKHIDYRDEKEFRICTFSKNEFEFLDIEGCIRAVIYCNFSGLRQATHEQMNELAARKNVKVIQVAWSQRNVSAWQLN